MLTLIMVHSLSWKVQIQHLEKHNYDNHVNVETVSAFRNAREEQARKLEEESEKEPRSKMKEHAMMDGANLLLLSANKKSCMKLSYQHWTKFGNHFHRCQTLHNR